MSSKRYAIVTDETHRLSASTVEIVLENANKNKSLVFAFSENLSSEVVWINRNQYEEVTEYAEDVNLTVGERITHCKDSDLLGEIIYIDLNLIADGSYSTTCLVLWDGGDIADVQWTNKLEPADELIEA